MPQLLECGAGYEEARAAEFAKAQEESDSEDEELGEWSRDDFSLGAKAVAVPLLRGQITPPRLGPAARAMSAAPSTASWCR